ncbi:hypothetical protein JCM13304A_24500 [Desulfothermus okinawensis JCM 13304]
MFRKKILIPYNFKPRDEKSIHYAIKNFSGDNSIFISVLHLHSPIPKIGAFTLGKSELIKNLGKKITDFRQKEEEFFKLKELFLENNFSEEQLEFLFTPKKESIAKDILEVIKNKNFSTIILNRASGKRISTFGESVSMKLISLLKDKEIIILI